MSLEQDIIGLQKEFESQPEEGRRILNEYKTACDGCGAPVDSKTAVKDPRGQGVYDYYCPECGALDPAEREERMEQQKAKELGETKGGKTMRLKELLDKRSKVNEQKSVETKKEK